MEISVNVLGKKEFVSITVPQSWLVEIRPGIFLWNSDRFDAVAVQTKMKLAKLRNRKYNVASLRLEEPDVIILKVRFIRQKRATAPEPPPPAIVEVPVALIPEAHQLAYDIGAT